MPPGATDSRNKWDTTLNGNEVDGKIMSVIRARLHKAGYTEQTNLADKVRPDKRAMHGALQLVPETALSIDVVWT